jgi:uncharacterized protein
VIVIDVTVLIALFRRQHEHHDAARRWWDESSRSRISLTVPDLVWVGFLRIVTNRRIFDDPDDFAEAWLFTQALTSHPTYVAPAAGPRQLDGFAELCLEARCVGELITDAYIAAFARGLGAEVATFDRDFRRFRDLRVLELA